MRERLPHQGLAWHGSLEQLHTGVLILSTVMLRATCVGYSKHRSLFLTHAFSWKSGAGAYTPELRERLREVAAVSCLSDF